MMAQLLLALAVRAPEANPEKLRILNRLAF